MITSGIPAGIGLQQRVLPYYRAPFFDALADALPGGLAVLAGESEPGETIPQAESLRQARWTRTRNRYVGWGRFRMLWQSGWKAWIEKEKPDVLIEEANPKYLSNLFLQKDMHHRRRPVVGWSLGPVRTGRLFTPILKSYYAQFAAILVYSRNGAEQFQRMGIDRRKVFLAPNAVHSETAEHLLRRAGGREDARKHLGLGGSPMILFVGRLQRRKRVDLLLGACRKAEMDCRLLVVGDGPERERLERLARDVFPAARFTGDLRGEELGECFLAADLFILPGTGGLALQEAMLYGKPVAAAEADGSQRDLIREGENGWMIPPGDEDALAAVLRRAFSDPARLKQMGDASRRIVRETATMEKMVAGFLEALRYAARQTQGEAVR